MANGGLFATPEQVQAALAQERLGNAQLFGTIRPGHLVGSTFGSMFEGLDPRLQQADRLQRISQDLAAQGLSPGTAEYTKALVPQVQAQLGTAAALEAHKMALAAEERQIQIQGLRGPGPNRTGLMKSLINRVGMDPDVAVEFATNHPEISAKMVQERTKLTPLEKNSLRAAQGDPAKQADIINQALVKPLVQQTTISPGARARETRMATVQATFEILDKEVERTTRENEIAQEEFQRNPTSSQARLRANNASRALQTAVAARANWQGEPSNEVARRFDIPGPVRQAIMDAWDRVMGGGQKGSGAGRFSAMAADQMIAVDIGTLSDAEVEAYNARMDELGL